MRQKRYFPVVREIQINIDGWLKMQMWIPVLRVSFRLIIRTVGVCVGMT